MPDRLPSKVLITGGQYVGGVASFAEALGQGFSERGIAAEIISPREIYKRLGELRDPGILKIFSTTAVFAAPLARRAICVAHGVPRTDYVGWKKAAGIINSFQIANRSPGAQLVSVSHYTAATLRAIFNVRTDAVIHNPLKSLFLEPYSYQPSGRCWITYAGRLNPVKNVHRVIPAIKDLLDETGLRMCIIGEGPLRPQLERMVADDSRFEFQGAPNDVALRNWLRRTRVFVSANEAEGFGIAYVEAMTQGCVVAMPAGGGGLEISPERIGSGVQLLPISWDRAELLAAFRAAVLQDWSPVSTDRFTVSAVAGFYLDVNSRFSLDGRSAAPRSVKLND